MKAILVIALCIILTGCTKYRETVFIVPDGFRGHLVLVIIEGLPVGYKIENNRYVYRFPDSGVLCIGNTLKNIVNTWDQNTARYESGKEIPRAIYNSEPEQKFDDVRFGLLGDTGGGYTKDRETGRVHNFRHNEFWAVIGSSSEIAEVNNVRWKESPRHAIEHCLKKKLN